MTYEEVQKLLLRLSPEQGLAIRLKYEEGLTLEEIAGNSAFPRKPSKAGFTREPKNCAGF